MVDHTKSLAKTKKPEAYRVPPQNIEAEKCILGIVLLESSSIFEIFAKLSPDDFYLQAHKIIFKTMVDLFSQSRPQLQR